MLSSAPPPTIDPAVALSLLQARIATTDRNLAECLQLLQELLYETTCPHTFARVLALVERLAPLKKPGEIVFCADERYAKRLQRLEDRAARAIAILSGRDD